MSAGADARLPWHTHRLCLRRLHVGDVEAFHACRSDARVARWQGWAPFTRAQSQDFVAAQANGAFPILGGWRQLAIARRADDTLLGDAGIWLAADGSEAECGLSLMHAVQGQGFGSEAVAGLLGLLFTATAVQRVHASADARNIPCRAALLRAGMTCVGTQPIEAKGECCTEWQFAIERDAWQAASRQAAAT